jgi:2,2-dialkylglycine decarboxylase (pyruvate)
MEIVQRPGGHVVFAPEYYTEVQRICRERGVLLIVDEVQTGLGRCGTLWACDLFDIEPDIIVFGKAFGGGFPFGGFTIRPELVPEGVEEEPWHVVTFMNQPLQAAAGLAVIGVVEREALVERANVLGHRATSFLSGVRERYRVVGDVRGPGLFIGIDLVEDRVSRRPASAACRKAWSYALGQGLMTWFGGAGNVLKLKPPLMVSDADFDTMLELIERTIAFVEREVHGRKPPPSLSARLSGTTAEERR